MQQHAVCDGISELRVGCIGSQESLTDIATATFRGPGTGGGGNVCSILQAEYAVVDKAIQRLAAGPKKAGEESTPSQEVESDFDIQSASEWPGIRR